MTFPLLIGGAPSRYRINQSLRFRASNSANLLRVPGAASNRRTWTFSAWVKRGALGAARRILSVYQSNNDNQAFNIGFDTSDRLNITGWSTFWRTTNAVYRDPTAWMHVVITVDTTDATANNRVRLWVNGLEVTSFSALNNPSLNADLGVNTTGSHRLGVEAFDLTAYFDGYMAEVILVDGQALTPSSFGQINPATNSWVPRRYTGTYGTNGFYLPFNDAASTTTLCLDRSGNGNNWTSSGISVTSGSTFDQMLDTPTNNFPTLNPLADATNYGASPGISAANLNSTGQNAGTIITTFPMTTGKWYCEVVSTFSGGNHYFGVRRLTSVPTGTPWDQTISSIQSGGWYDGNGNFTASGAATWSSGDTLGMTWDADAGTLTIRVNNVQEFSHTDTAWIGAQVVFTHSPSAPTGQSQIWNFGQRAFAYTPPAGFVALNTANLPNPTILRGDDGFFAGLRTGTGTADGQTQTVTGVRFAPDLVWNKSRSNAFSHNLVDRVRGDNNLLFSNSDIAETNPGAQLALTSDGFTATQRAANAATNQNGVTYVHWLWREGAAYGFDIVNFSKTTGVQNVSHTLNAVPHMMILKRRTGAGSWVVYHRNTGASPQNQAMFLNLTDAVAAYPNVWNNTAPTSSQFTVGSDLPNGPDIYVTYLWTSIPGFSLFSSYTGNGSTDGPFVWCGFRPRFVMIKRVDSTGDWLMNDAARSPSNVVGENVWANLSNAEAVSNRLDFASGGFKLRNNFAEHNASGGTYIFAAFAETPFKTANAR